jgi:hypothetical protein
MLRDLIARKNKKKLNFDYVPFLFSARVGGSLKIITN